MKIKSSTLHNLLMLSLDEHCILEFKIKCTMVPGQRVEGYKVGTSNEQQQNYVVVFTLEETDRAPQYQEYYVIEGKTDLKNLILMDKEQDLQTLLGDENAFEECPEEWKPLFNFFPLLKGDLKYKIRKTKN